MSESELFDRVNNALGDLKKFVREDGGDLELVEITPEMVARVELKGACLDCSMNNMTFRAGIEEAILKDVPQITRVESVTPLNC